MHRCGLKAALKRTHSKRSARHHASLALNMGCGIWVAKRLECADLSALFLPLAGTRILSGGI